MDDLIVLFGEYVELSKEVIVVYKQKLADALANDVADLASINSAQESADNAKLELEQFRASVEQKSVDFTFAIEEAKKELTALA